MNSDIMKGNWKQFKGSIRQQWGKLTDDDMAYAEGSYDRFIGRIQERYGVTRDEAEKQVRDWDSSRAA